MTAAVADPGQLARFQLMRVLGRGAQAKVWLAHDPRLDRDVALKLLDAAAEPASLSQWLQEARAVSRLTHPNIVPVFEADECDGQPYLVFEFVEGPTLAQARQGKKAMAAKAAVELMLGVLDALAAAHDEGIVHRDLKPSNILLGRDGRPRVMDFGIAARVVAPPQTGDGRIVGTPGYISPEAARGEAPVPAMDVFAAGVVLGELLSGASLLQETDPYRAVERVQREDLYLPPQVQVDPTLRGIVQRALSRKVDERYDSARSMHTALKSWLHPEGAADPEAGGSHATLEFLLRRMRHKTDFPALSSSVVRIQQLATSESESLKSLTDEILKDVALTHKLLRMVNTAHFTAVAGGGIGTVSRAVALIGFAGIRNMAVSAVLLEHMIDKHHASQLKDEFLRALTAGTLADQLTSLAREGEEAFLGAMFQNLGRMLTECYLPEEALLIRQAISGQEHTPAGHLAREVAARRVLGMSLDDLGNGVARAWGLPEGLLRALRMPDAETPPREPERGTERLRWLGRSSNALADAMLAHDGDAQAEALRLASELYAPVLGMKPRDVVDACHTTRSRVNQMAKALGLNVAPGAAAQRLLAARHDAAGADAPTLVQGKVAAPRPTPTPMMDRLTKAVEEVRGALTARTMRLPEVLQFVLDSMLGAVSFRRVVLCLREPNTGRLVGRIGLGPGAGEISSAFRITPDSSAVGDIFAWLSAKGADLLVSDAAVISGRLPPWYRQHVHAATFLLLPLMVKGAPIGLIYADKAKAGTIVLAEGELALLRALRDHAIAAFAQALPGALPGGAG